MVLSGMLTAVAAVALLVAGPVACQTCDLKTHALVGKPPVCLPRFLQQAKVTGPGITSHLGEQVVLSATGNTMAVLENLDDRALLHIYVRSGGKYTQQAAINFPRHFDGFTGALAISGDGSTLAAQVNNFRQKYIADTVVFVYKRGPSGVWSRQSGKIFPPDAIGVNGYMFEQTLALSTDGTLLAFGRSGDAKGKGATWVYRFDGSEWKSTGPKLVGSGGGPKSRQGTSVALSADGSILAFGGTGPGPALWIFTRNKAGVYKQSAGPLRDGEFLGTYVQAASLALSADGSVLAAGVQGSSPGGARVFVRKGDAWTQQGPALVGAAGNPKFLQSQVALSGDGKTLAISVRYSDEDIGGVIVFVNSRGKWLPLGKKLVGTGAAGQPNQGWCVALSADGTTLATGGPFNDDRKTFETEVGAVWVFRRTK